jgi:hypothetical protein
MYVVQKAQAYTYKSCKKLAHAKATLDKQLGLKYFRTTFWQKNLACFKIPYNRTFCKQNKQFSTYLSIKGSSKVLIMKRGCTKTLGSNLIPAYFLQNNLASLKLHSKLFTT